MLYILTSIWVLHNPNPGRNSHFRCFSAKKQKKQKICSKFLQITGFFIGKNVFLEKKPHFFWNKTVDQHSGANLKNVFFANISRKFFFCFFCRKNAENVYFNQHLVCAAPKRWSKYTTTSLLFTFPASLSSMAKINLTSARYPALQVPPTRDVNKWRNSWENQWCQKVESRWWLCTTRARSQPSATRNEFWFLK